MSYLEINNVVLTLNLKVILITVLVILWFNLANNPKLTKFMHEKKGKNKLIFTIPYMLLVLPVMLFLALAGGFASLGLYLSTKLYQWAYTKLAKLLNKK